MICKVASAYDETKSTEAKELQEQGQPLTRKQKQALKSLDKTIAKIEKKEEKKEAKSGQDPAIALGEYLECCFLCI